MKTRSIPILLFYILICWTSQASIAQDTYEIYVSAGAFDRSQSVVTFTFPASVKPGTYPLINRSHGNALLQVDHKNRGWFIIDQLQAGHSRTYLFNGKQTVSKANISSKIDSTQITFYTKGNPILSYYHGDNSPPEELDERYRRGGYIHPVFSPDGVRLTSHLNIGSHPHQSGIWSAWTKTEFDGRTPDFWNVHLNSGRVDQADSLKSNWQGPVHGGFIATHLYTDLSSESPVTALNELWTVYVYQSPDDQQYRMFDLEVTQTVNSGKPLILPEYHYGGVGFRGHEDWINPKNITFLTAEGLGREGHASRTKWTHIGGLSSGKLAGLTIMGHPGNFRSPQPVRIHPDAPFFNYAPTQLGEMRIEPGLPYIVRYRFITYDGDPDPAQLNRMWNDYAYPPQVTVKGVN